MERNFAEKENINTFAQISINLLRMKRILISIVMLVSALNIFAEPDVKVRMGLQAGYNMSKWNGDFNDAYGTSFKHGFHAGAVAEIQLNSKWSIQPGFMICSEGTKLKSLPFGASKGQTSGIDDFSDELDFGDFEIDLGDLNLDDLLGALGEELGIDLGGSKDSGKPGVAKDVKVGAVGFKLPIDVMYSIYKGPGRIVPSLGMYVTGYVGGKTLDEGTFADESVFKENWYADIEQTKDWIPDQFDYGLSVKVMYEMMKDPINGLYWQIGAQRGFTSCQNMVFMATIGYKFQYIKALRSRYNTGILEYNP